MKEETILEAILPVAQQTKTCLIGTTTPSGSDHIVSTMITAKDEKGHPVIATVRIGKPCEECRKLRVLCTHAENTVAEGTSRKKRKRYAALYETKEHIKMREYQGEIGDSSRSIYQPAWINELKQSKLVDVPNVIDCIFVTSDPAQGGSCEWATIGAYFDRARGEMVICLLDAIKLNKASPSELKKNFTNSIRTLRSSHAVFSQTPIVCCIESAPNTFSEAIDEYAEFISNQDPELNMICMREMPKGRSGVPKDNPITRIMCERSAMFMESESVKFSKYCVTSIETSTIDKEKNKFLSQLERLARKVDEKTGKVRIDGKDGGSNDDYAVAFMMQTYWYEYFWRSDKEYYKNFKSYSASWRSSHFKMKDYKPNHRKSKKRKTIAYNNYVENKEKAKINNMSCI